MERTTFLRTAKTNLDRSRLHEKYGRQSEMRDCLTVTAVMSAAAIEAQINLMITLPSLGIENRKLRMFYGHLATMEHMSVGDKLRILHTTYLDEDYFKTIRNDVFKVMGLRNRIVHASPNFQELRYIPDEYWNDHPDGAGDIDEDSLPTKASLAFWSSETELLEHTESNFNIASGFIERCDELISGNLQEVIRDYDQYNENNQP